MHQPSRHRNRHRHPHHTPAATTGAARIPQTTPRDKASSRQRARSTRGTKPNHAPAPHTAHPTVQNPLTSRHQTRKAAWACMWRTERRAVQAVHTPDRASMKVGRQMGDRRSGRTGSYRMLASWKGVGREHPAPGRWQDEVLGWWSWHDHWERYGVGGGLYPLRLFVKTRGARFLLVIPSHPAEPIAPLYRETR